MARLSNPKPGGYGRRRRPAPAAEPAHNPARRGVEALDRAIVDAIADGPLMKWELRDRLHEPEHAIYKRLRALRDAGRVKPVGKRLAERRWALASWQAPAIARPRPYEPPERLTPHEPPPTESWWAKHAAPDQRDEFIDAAKARDAELRPRHD